MTNEIDEASFDIPKIKSVRYEYEFVPADFEEFKSWCLRQIVLYERVVASWRYHQNDQALSQVFSSANNLVNLRSKIEALDRSINESNRQEIESHLNDFAHILNEAFTTFGFPPADSEAGAMLMACVEADDSIGLPALYALTSHKGLGNRQFSYWQPEIFRGLGIGAAISAKEVLRRRPNSVSKALREVAKESQAGIGRTRAQANLTLRDLRKNAQNFADKFIGFEIEHTNKLTQSENQLDTTLKDARKEIDDFKSFVKSEIALKAPVTYWETKATEHENRAFFFGIVVFILMFLCGVGAYQSIGFVKEITGDGNKTNYAGIAVVAVLVTLILWMLRLVVRLFLSQQHLGSDARERTAMVKTYLALKEAGVAPNNGDLTPVLVALFRPSSDGIVKDEAMPPVLAEILTRTKN